MLRESALTSHRGSDCVARPAEDDEEGIPLRVDLDATVRDEGPAKQVPVDGEEVLDQVVPSAYGWKAERGGGVPGRPRTPL